MLHDGGNVPCCSNHVTIFSTLVCRCGTRATFLFVADSSGSRKHKSNRPDPFFVASADDADPDDSGLCRRNN